MGPTLCHPGGVKAAFAKRPATVSYTAPFLAEVLAAGPHAQRAKYDPHAAAAERPGDLKLEAVGKDAAMPWETDGKRWHTIDRLTSKGKPCRWEGTILTWIEEQINKRGKFGETNWKQPTVVEIAGQQKSQGWFFHAHTSMEWLVRLVFRVKRNTFKNTDLIRKLAIPPLNDTPGVEAYSNSERVHVANRKGPWQEVAILAHRLSEVETPAFHKFLNEAVLSFQANLQKMQQRPEDVMPWKVNGERWHLSDKGFPIGKKLRWDRGLLPRLLEIVRTLEPGLEITWDSRAAITLRVPGIGRGWSQWRTKDAHGLDCRFLGKKGQFNLAQIEDFGLHPEIIGKEGRDILHLIFQQVEHMPAAGLKELLADHLRGFREVFGKMQMQPT
jgi:excinuclease ABC subunit A